MHAGQVETLVSVMYLSSFHLTHISGYYDSVCTLKFYKPDMIGQELSFWLGLKVSHF